LPDSTSSKTSSRWKGPAVIGEKRSPYSYIVEIEGARQHIHTNHLPKFYARVDEVVCDQECMSLLTDSSDDLDVLNVNSSSCAIVYDNDVDFGDIHVIEPSVVSSNIVNELLPSQKLIYLFSLINQLKRRLNS